MRLTRADVNTDWPAVRQLLQDAFAYMERRLGHPARAAQVSAGDLATEANTGTVFLIFDGTRPVACLFCRRSRDHPDALYLGKLAVAASHRGRGLARDLVEAATQTAEAQGFSALTLDTGTAFPELLSLFQTLGFGPPAPREGDPGVVTMMRPLASQEGGGTTGETA
ncbi:MAG: GNAT family N-acetyltransferase [Rhodobacter sp.]|nr:GNAT family N-acetyltransferase [Rhodobacter sp.]